MLQRQEDLGSTDLPPVANAGAFALEAAVRATGDQLRQTAMVDSKATLRWRTERTAERAKRAGIGADACSCLMDRRPRLAEPTVAEAQMNLHRELSRGHRAIAEHPAVADLLVVVASAAASAFDCGAPGAEAKAEELVGCRSLGATGGRVRGPEVGGPIALGTGRPRQGEDRERRKEPRDAHGSFLPRGFAATKKVVRCR